MTNKLEELKKEMEEAKDIALSARVNNGVTFKYAKIIDDGELPKREDNNEVWTEISIKEEYRTFSECASLYLDAKKAYETELDKHIPNKLEELKKEMEEAEVAYKAAYKARDDAYDAWTGSLYANNGKVTNDVPYNYYFRAAETADEYRVYGPNIKLCKSHVTSAAFRAASAAYDEAASSAYAACAAYNKELNKNKNNE